MNLLRSVVLWFAVAGLCIAATPVNLSPVRAPHAMVVAAHPEAAAIGVAVLQAGGNAIDAAVATSLAVGVAEPYGSGLGGKLMLLYYDARAGTTQAVDAMDACGSAIDVAAYRKLPESRHAAGYTSVCVPGLPAGLWLAHQRWGRKPWADDVKPAVELARRGFLVLPKTRDFFEEQTRKLHGGDAELAKWYLPGGDLPVVGSRLANADLAKTLERFAAEGRDGFYRGSVAQALAAAARTGGGWFTADDLAKYEARITAPFAMDFRRYHLVAAPAPAWGAALYLPIMKVLENETFGGRPLRDADNLDLMGRVWRLVAPEASRGTADDPQARANFERSISPAAIAALRARLHRAPVEKAAILDVNPEFESALAATTQWMIIDADGNIACCTQSLSLHFGAGVIAPGTGVVLNDSMSNFATADPHSLNYLAAGKRARSTIAPTLVFAEGKPIIAVGIPGAARIPTALLQVLLDRLALDRPLADAIGDTRFHFAVATAKGEGDVFEAESSLPEETVTALRAKGWSVALPEEPGRGRHFGGVNAIERNADGTLMGYADPRRTNAAAGY